MMTKNPKKRKNSSKGMDDLRRASRRRMSATEKAQLEEFMRQQNKTTCKRFGGLLSYMDLFGQKIEFNINKKASSYQTPFGGIMSIILACGLSYYFYFLLYKILYNDDDFLYSTPVFVDLENEEPVNYESLQILNMFHVTRSDKTKDIPLDINRYLSFNFQI